MIGTLNYKINIQFIVYHHRLQFSERFNHQYVITITSKIRTSLETQSCVVNVISSMFLCEFLDSTQFASSTLCMSSGMIMSGSVVWLSLSPSSRGWTPSSTCHAWFPRHPPLPVFLSWQLVSHPASEGREAGHWVKVKEAQIWAQIFLLCLHDLCLTHVFITSW